MRNSLGVRFLFTTILMLVLAMGSGTIVSWLIAEDAMNGVVRNQLRSQILETVASTERWLANRRLDIAGLCQQKVYLDGLEDSFKGRAARRAAEEQFSRLALYYSFYYSLNLLDKNCNILASDLPEDQRAHLDIHPDLFGRACQGETVWTGVFRSKIDGERLIGIYSPLENDGHVAGVMYFQYNLQQLSNYFLSLLRVGESGCGFLLDSSDRIVAHSDPYHVGTFFKKEIIEGVGNSDFFIYEDKGHERIGFGSRIDAIGCTLVASIGADELQAPSRRLGFINLLITLGVVLTTILALFLLWRREVATPIDAILKGIERFRKGRLAIPVQFEVDNELQTVARSFNEMAEDIEKTTVSLAELRHEQKNLQTILDSMTTGILILDSQEKVQLLNRSLRLILCLGDKPVVGQELNHVAELDVALFQKLNRSIIEIEYINKDGKSFWLLRVVQHIQLSGDLVQVITLVDISEQKRVSEQQRQLETNMHYASRVKVIGTLSAGLTREIEGPVNSISENLRFLDTATSDMHALLELDERVCEEISASEDIPEKVEKLLLEKRAFDLDFLREEIPKTLYHSLSQVAQILRIISAMRSIGEDDSEIPTPCDLNDAVESIVAVSHNQWRSVARVDTELDMNLPDPLCVSGEINQVLLSLIVNAVDAIREKVSAKGELGKIRIVTWAEDDWCCISVWDSGVGMSSETLSRIFDPYFTTKPMGKGTGQGLFVAKRIIEEKHQGRLEVESEPGQGTLFTLKLPFTI